MARFTEWSKRKLREQLGVSEGDLEALKSHPLLDRITFRYKEDLLVVQTVQLSMKPETWKKKYESFPVGAFKISISTGTAHWGGIYIENLTNPRSGIHHPHAPHGSICAGALAAPINAAMEARNWPALIEYLLLFLQSYNRYDISAEYAPLWGAPGYIRREDR